MTTEYGIFSSDTIFALPPDGKKPIIENLLYERENVLLLANEKTGKSILAQQMLFCISGKVDFLGLKTIANPCLYAMFEGDKYDLKNNMDNMDKAIKCGRANLWILYHFGLTLNTDLGYTTFITLIDNSIRDNNMPIPKVIVIDCLYMAFQGHLSDDADGSNFCRNMRQLNDKYGCSIVLLHHTHRAKRTDKGDIIDEGDDKVYGSFIWKAFPSHILLLSNVVGKGKMLTCNTQRTGKIIDKLEMDFIEPSPLFFRVKGKYPWSMQVILDNIDRKGVTHEELLNKTKQASATIYKAIGEAMEEGLIEKVADTYPHRWRKL